MAQEWCSGGEAGVHGRRSEAAAAGAGRVACERGGKELDVGGGRTGLEAFRSRLPEAGRQGRGDGSHQGVDQRKKVTLSKYKVQRSVTTAKEPINTG
jgi:hypothetical protein